MSSSYGRRLRKAAAKVDDEMRIIRRVARKQERKRTMKRIKLPEPIILQEHKPATKESPEVPEIKLDLLWFARHFLNGAKFFLSTGPGIRASTRIEDAIMGGAEVGYFDLHDEDQELMVQLTEEPGDLGYPTVFSNTKTGEPVPMAPRVIARFVNAFKFATDVAEETAEAAQ